MRKDVKKDSKKVKKHLENDKFVIHLHRLTIRTGPRPIKEGLKKMRTLIKQSNSGRSTIELEGNQIFFNGLPILTLGNLKYLKDRGDFNFGYLIHLMDSLENVTPEPIDFNESKLVCRYVKYPLGSGKIDSVNLISDYSFRKVTIRHFSKTNTYLLNLLNVRLECDNHEVMYSLPTMELSLPADEVIAHETQKVNEKIEKALQKRIDEENSMREFLKGWYVVTVDVLVSKIKGNDGRKTYSFKVLADSQMDAYEKTVNLIMSEGVNDRNVSFVYEVCDSAKNALIEFVGVWTDEKELTYGPEKN